MDAYPRALADDAAKLEVEGVDAVFAPSVETMYPHGPRTTIQPGPLGSVLEGATRPTHLAGVLTVVAKLFALTGATYAFFGEKDYQQLALIRQMVDDPHLPVTIHGCPIVRDTDGLALSSRNRYLSAEDMSELPDGYTGPARLLVAAKVGATRLLDNAPIEL